MSKITQRILTILVILAVLVYVAISWINGRSDNTQFLIFAAMLSYFLISMVAGLVQDLREK